MCICCGNHMIWLPRIYRAIAYQCLPLLFLLSRLSADMSQYFPRKLCVDWNVIKGHFCLIITESHGGVCRHEYPSCVDTLHSTLIPFWCKLCVSILSRGTFISMFIKELCGILHRYEYPYCVVTSHSILITVWQHGTVNFNRYSWENCTVVNILSGGIFISISIK
jgi:hypothetical protein